MNNYEINQIVNATVERILSFGVFVRLDDGFRGYIRRRELDYDADVDPSQVVNIGDRIKAVVLAIGRPNKDIELSRRETLENPWPQFAKQHRIGTPVRCSVRAIQPHGVFVRIQAGIDGFISLDELSTEPVNKPEEVFWIGDSIEAVILKIQPRKELLRLSIKERIVQYDQALEASGTISKKLPNKTITPSKESPTFDKREKTKDDSNIYSKAGPVLVVEDDDDVRNALVTWIKGKGISVFSSGTVFGALKIRSRQYKIIIVDLHLFDDDGLDLIEHLKTDNNQANICIMSSPQMLEERAYDIGMAKVMDVFPKPLDLDEIERFILRVANNEQINYWQADLHKPDSLRRSVPFHFSETQTLARLQQALEDITSAVGAQTGILFQLDSDSHMISLPIQVGASPLNSSAIYGLRESPVNDVMRDKIPILENQVVEKAYAKFDKLLNLISFNSCLGIPIHVQGEVHHTAFFFHEDFDVFSSSNLDYAQVGGLLLSAILTEESLQVRLRALNPMLLSGELAASFGHDVFNKITALELETLNLATNSKSERELTSQKILDLILDLKKTTQAFQQLLRSSQVMESINYHQVIQQAAFLIRDLSRKEGAKVVLKLASDVPAISGNSILLQQAIINIMLNAIQQMAIKTEKLNWSGKRTLEISSVTKGDFLQIRFKDNGPGIHKESLHKIFLPGFSARGGSGLGLYIARSFIHMLGGILEVEETFIPIGTIFLIQLPLEKMEPKHE